VLAALPLYALAGDRLVTGPGGVFGLFAAPWPTRLFLLVPSPSDEPFSASGVGAGLLMALLDAGMVWAAAHWGASHAVRTGRLIVAPLRLAGHALVLGLVLPAFAGVAVLWGASWALAIGVVCQLAESPSGQPPLFGTLAVGVGLVAAVLFFLYVWRLYPLTMAAERVLQDFADFDRLVDDELYEAYLGPGGPSAPIPLPVGRP
jgi:hypothetical protein